MGIGGITSSNGMSAMQFSATDLKDQKSKSIQKEITDVQQKMQKLSSENELSVNEKENERKELKREKSSLDTKLKQHQDELLRSHKREIKLAELQEDRKPEEEKKADDKVDTTEASSDTADEKKLPAEKQQAAQPGTIITQNEDGTVILKGAINQTEDSTSSVPNKPAEETSTAAAAAEETEPEKDETETEPTAEFRPTEKEMRAMVSADSSMQVANHIGTLVSKTNDGIAVLKSEIKQDDYRGTDTEGKQAELKDMQKQRQQEMAFQFTFLGDAAHTMKTADEDSEKNAAYSNAEKNFQVSGLSTPQEEQAAQQGFQVSIA